MLQQMLSDFGMSYARLNRARPHASGRSLRLLLKFGAERISVGMLTYEDDEYVFRYSPDYRRRGLPPIAEFPDTSEVYRSEHLWPFFEVRVPPLNRPDIVSLLEEKGIRPTDLFGILGRIASRSVTSPFEFELQGT